MINKLLKNLFSQRQEQRQTELYRNLIRHEARIGGQLFGPVGKGGRREFFCLDRHTWVWHEEWKDDNGQQKTKTTRYDVRPSGILKAQDGQHYQEVDYQEAKHLYEAALLYQQRIREELYNYI